MSEVRQVFRAGSLNRVDEIIVFHALTNEEIEAIARLLVGQVAASAVQERGIRPGYGRFRDSAALGRGGLRGRSTARVRFAARFSEWSRTRLANSSCSAISAWAITFRQLKRTAKSCLPPSGRQPRPSLRLNRQSKTEFKTGGTHSNAFRLSIIRRLIESHRFRFRCQDPAAFRKTSSPVRRANTLPTRFRRPSEVRFFHITAYGAEELRNPRIPAGRRSDRHSSAPRLPRRRARRLRPMRVRSCAERGIRRFHFAK